jgi:hypothetical protein
VPRDQIDKAARLQIDKAIKAIEDAKPYLDNYWYEKMQKIIKEKNIIISLN